MEQTLWILSWGGYGETQPRASAFRPAHRTTSFTANREAARMPSSQRISEPQTKYRFFK